MNIGERKVDRVRKLPICRSAYIRTRSTLLTLKLYFWIEVFELNTSVVTCKMPRNTFLRIVTVYMPFCQYIIECIKGWYSYTKKALSSQC